MLSIKQESECCCCFSKEDLFSMLEPYNYEDTSEIYANMIAECFQTETKASIQEYYRHLFVICKKCVFGLRDAIVLQSQIQIAYDRIQQLLACHKEDSDKCTLNPDIKPKDPIEFSDNTDECCCCFSKEDLFSMLEPYNYKETIEIYATMIAECFQIETKASIQEYYKNLYVICKDCVFRLRDAIVLRSQIQIAYNRIQELSAYHVVEINEYKFNPDIKLNNPIEYSNMETKEIKWNPNISESHKFAHHIAERDECSDVETKENTWNLDTKCDSMAVESADPIPNNILKMKSLKIVLEKLDMNKIRDITNNYAKESRKDHVVFNSNIKSNKCKFCEKAYASKSALWRHEETHLNPQKYTCKHCNTIFSSTSVLLIHEKIHLNIKDFICDYCNKEFRKKSDLKTHILTHWAEKTKCEFCEKVYTSKSALFKHVKTHSNPLKYTCKHCNKIFSSTVALSKHEKIHLNIIDFICDYCKKGFVSKYYLQNHILTHSDGVVRKCEFCEKIFTTKKAFLEHMKAHTNPEKYTCKHCNKIFSSTAVLLIHEKIHLNIKDFVCEYCNKEFRSRRSLNRHTLTHSAGKMKCEFCEKVYASKCTLLKHMKTHSNPQNYTCKHCNKIFSSTNVLLLHEKIHLNIRDFTCNQCNKGFITKYNLQNHMLTHSDGKIGKCQF